MSFKFIIQNKAASEQYPKGAATFKYEVKENSNLTGNEIPFPPYIVNQNLETYILISSIFAPFIGENNYSEIDKSPLLKWIYKYKINYPHIPNILDLVLAIGLNPDDKLDIKNDTTFRYVVHQFCKTFAVQSGLKVKDFSIAIPKNDTIFKNVDDDIVVFVPIITPIASFEIIDKSENKQENSGEKIKFLFPTSFTSKNEKEKEKGKSQSGPAFASENENDNNNNNNNNDDDDDDNNNSNQNADIDKNETVNYSFYGGIFESDIKAQKYILIKIDKKYYKYNCGKCSQDYHNCVEVIESEKEMIINDYCITAFFVKNDDKLLPRLYQKITE